MDEKITSLLRKVKALADAGIAGERDVARSKLEALMRKHGLTVADLLDQDITWHEFRCPASAKNIFVNIVCEVLDKARIKLFAPRKGCIKAPMTRAEAADVNAMLSHYLKIYHHERKKLLAQLRQLPSAINARFGIAEDVEGDDSPRKKLSPAEIAALLKLLSSVSGERWQKPCAMLAP